MIYLLLVVVCVTGYKDITERRIPNLSHYFILLISYSQLLLANEGHKSLTDFLPLIGVLLIGAVMTRLGILGFGDVKLIFTVLLVSPAASYTNILYFIFFSGGCWAVIWQYILRRIPLIRKIDKVGEGVPYAIPILMSLCLFSYVTML